MNISKAKRHLWAQDNCGMIAMCQTQLFSVSHISYWRRSKISGGSITPFCTLCLYNFYVVYLATKARAHGFYRLSLTFGVTREIDIPFNPLYANRNITHIYQYTVTPTHYHAASHIGAAPRGRKASSFFRLCPLNRVFQRLSRLGLLSVMFCTHFCLALRATRGRVSTKL